MSVNWDHGLIKWRNHVQPDGRQFDLTHLHPLQMRCDLPPNGGIPAKVVTINVGFGLHTFTEHREPGHAPGTAVRDNREVRTFCPIRYQGSLKLPDIVRELPGHKCQFAKNENYVVVTRGSSVYAVFFNVMQRRQDGPNDMMLFVQSAYPLDQNKKNPGLGKISFLRLVELTMQRIKPKAPPKR